MGGGRGASATVCSLTMWHPTWHLISPINLHRRLKTMRKRNTVTAESRQGARAAERTEAFLSGFSVRATIRDMGGFREWAPVGFHAGSFGPIKTH